MSLAIAPDPAPEPLGYLTPQDHADLAKAITLVSGVVIRHAMEMPLPVVGTFDLAIFEIRIGERRMREGS